MAAAERKAASLGYETIILTDELDCEASEAGRMFGSIARYYHKLNKKIAVIAGGETVVTIKGTGRGGRNQELALSAADYINGMDNVLVFSMGSDGTDGPTDAAGGFVDGNTSELLSAQGKGCIDYLVDNDSYHALELTGGLIKTGATGTNVNDLTVLLVSGNK